LIELFESKKKRRKFGHNMDRIVKPHNEKLEEWFVLFNTCCYQVQEVGMVM
jgi:hypothetical protein